MLTRRESRQKEAVSHLIVYSQVVMEPTAGNDGLLMVNHRGLLLCLPDEWIRRA